MFAGFRALAELASGMCGGTGWVFGGIEKLGSGGFFASASDYEVAPTLAGMGHCAFGDSRLVLESFGELSGTLPG